MREALFLIDSAEGREFPGYTDGRTWNGWACPYFTFDQAQRIIAAWQECGWKATYDAEQDAFYFAVDDEDPDGEIEEFGPVEIEGKTLYPIGNACWIWDEADPAHAEKKDAF